MSRELPVEVYLDVFDSHCMCEGAIRVNLEKKDICSPDYRLGRN